MGVFPLPEWPTQDFRAQALGFGTQRKTIAHAACDLVAPAEAPCFAMFDGVVWYGRSPFFVSKPRDASACEACAKDVPFQTFEMALVTEHGIFRYGEIGPWMAPLASPGGRVAAGDVIAKVGPQNGSTMLHLEWFSDAGRRDPLTQMGNMTYLNVAPANYNRRSDLADPTDLLTGLLVKGSALAKALEAYR